MNGSKDVIAKLVSFNTESQNSNLAIVEWLSQFLTDAGGRVLIVPAGDGVKASMIASFGPDVPGGVVLSGHTDVVPSIAADWTSDPYSCVERNGRLYGRGTCDMKGFVGIATACVARMNKAALRRPIHLCFSHDEELGCLGVPILIEALKANRPPAAAVIVGEPSGMKVIEQHKGVLSGSFTLKGVEAHSSMPQNGVSAAHFGARLVTEVLDWAEGLRNTPNANDAFDPPFSTLNVGLITSGTATNVVARSFQADWLMRVLPGEDSAAYIADLKRIAARFQTAMQAHYPACSVSLAIDGDLAPLRREPDPTAADLCRRLSGATGSGAVSYNTEAGLFQAAGFSTAICGPGSISQAHKPDEFVELSQIAACERFVEKLIDEQSL